MKYVNTFVDKKTGRTYAHYRRAGHRIPIKATIGTPEFFTEISEIEAGFRDKTTPEIGTLGHLVMLFKQSQHWRELKPKTQLSYHRAFEALQGVEDTPIAALDRVTILRLRDEALMPVRGRWMANYVVTVLGILLGFAFDRGMIGGNPLSDRVRKIRKPLGSARANRPWTAAERIAVLAEAPAHIRLPIALAMASGLRKGDVLAATMAAVKDGSVHVRTAKRDRPVAVPIHPLLTEALALRPPSAAVQIALTSRGEPWTESGFNASWAKFKRRLEAAGKIEPGLTIHGLRHTLGTLLKEAGVDDGDIADVLGQAGTSMSRHYSREAELPAATRAAVVSLDFRAKPGTRNEQK